MAEGAPVLPFFGVWRNDVIPQTVRVVVGAQPRVYDVNMLVLPQLLFDVRPFEQYLLPLVAALLVLGEAHAMHHQFCMSLLDGLDLHETFSWSSVYPRRLYISLTQDQKSTHLIYLHL